MRTKTQKRLKLISGFLGGTFVMAGTAFAFHMQLYPIVVVGFLGTAVFINFLIEGLDYALS